MDKHHDGRTLWGMRGVGWKYIERFILAMAIGYVLETTVFSSRDLRCFTPTREMYFMLRH
jgi:hypothetical protein